MGEGTLTWTELKQVLDEMEASEGGISPDERRFTESAILSGARRIGHAEVRGYTGSADKAGTLSAGQFQTLTEKLRAAADRLPADQRARAGDAFLQGTVPIAENEEVQGYSTSGHIELQSFSFGVESPTSIDSGSSSSGGPHY